jgi:hypothetical protein
MLCCISCQSSFTDNPGVGVNIIDDPGLLEPGTRPAECSFTPAAGLWHGITAGGYCSYVPAVMPNECSCLQQLADSCRAASVRFLLGFWDKLVQPRVQMVFTVHSTMTWMVEGWQMLQP